MFDLKYQTRRTIAKNRISTTNPQKPSPATRNGTLSVDIDSIKDRLKTIEENNIQETRISAVESEFNQLKESNRQLQLTYDLLRSDIDALQFVSTQLCHSETKFIELEAQCTRLTKENEDLKKSVADLNSEIGRIKLTTSAIDTGISKEQEELNANVIIRGVEVRENAEESELLTVYNKICTHLGIVDSPEHEPITAKILSSNNIPSATAVKPIQIKLRSSAAKRQFLQARRIKRDILPSDIGIVQQSKKALLITEQLTRKNQEILYQARSLRGHDRFKFVWSNNGQILARETHRSKVIRIIDINHINNIKVEFLQVTQNGQYNTTESERTDQHHT